MSLPAGSVLDAILLEGNKQDGETPSATPTIEGVLCVEEAEGSSREHRLLKRKYRDAQSKTKRKGQSSKQTLAHRTDVVPETRHDELDTTESSGELAALHKKIDQLTSIISTITPVVKNLKLLMTNAVTRIQTRLTMDR